MSERFHRPQRFELKLWVPLVLACSLAGCATKDDRPLLSAPVGAVAPAGLGEIRRGMSQKEVLRLLRPFHRVEHAADAKPGGPLVDRFVYVENGAKTYAEIFYEGDRVLDVRFGYAEPFVFSHE